MSDVASATAEHCRLCGAQPHVSRTCAQTLTPRHTPSREKLAAWLQRPCLETMSGHYSLLVCVRTTHFSCPAHRGRGVCGVTHGPRSRWLEAHSILIRLGPSRTSRTDEAAERCRLHGRRPLSLVAARDGAFGDVFFAQNNANLLRKHAQNDAFGHPRRGGLWHRRHAPRCRKGAPREKGVLRTDGRTRGCGT